MSNCLLTYCENIQELPSKLFLQLFSNPNWNISISLDVFEFIEY